MPYLTLVVLGPAVQMEEAVAVGTEVAATVAHDDGGGLAVVVVLAGRARGRALPTPSGSGPLARGQPLDVVLVEHAERGQRQPEDGELEALGGIAVPVLQLRQVQDVLGDGALRDDGPVVADLMFDVIILLNITDEINRRKMEILPKKLLFYAKN
jgi:hypothetical protein